MARREPRTHERPLGVPVRWQSPESWRPTLAGIRPAPSDDPAATSAGLARAAFARADPIFQIALPLGRDQYIDLSEPEAQGKTGAGSGPIRSSARALAAIEAEGWRIFEASYVLDPNAKVPSPIDAIIGIYLFARQDPDDDSSR